MPESYTNRFLLRVSELLRCRSFLIHKKHRKESAERKISRQLDLVNFLKHQMITQLLLKIQYSKVERYMARRQFQSFIVLDSEESHSTSQTDSDEHRFDPGAFYGEMNLLPALFEGMHRPVRLNNKKFERQLTLATPSA